MNQPPPHTKEIIGVFRNRLNIGTLELLENGKYIFLINTANRERLLADNFPFDNLFQKGETVRICETLPDFITGLIPQRLKDVERVGILATDSDWVKLTKSALLGNPKSDNVCAQLMPVYTGEKLVPL